VEFVLVFPWVALLFFSLLDLSFLTIKQFRLEQVGHRVARHLALSDKSSCAEMEAAARVELNQTGFGACRVQLQLIAVAMMPSKNSLRKPRKLQLVDLSLADFHRPFSPFLKLLAGDSWIPVAAHFREVKSRS
jgi:hypothetical protein